MELNFVQYSLCALTIQIYLGYSLSLNKLLNTTLTLYPIHCKMQNYIMVAKILMNLLWSRKILRELWLILVHMLLVHCLLEPGCCVLKMQFWRFLRTAISPLISLNSALIKPSDPTKLSERFSKKFSISPSTTNAARYQSIISN